MKPKILLVDDEVNVLQAYTRVLRSRFALESAESGSQALEVLKANGPFAAIVSDMRMPGMDGVELLSWVRELYPDTVRIMLTGNADQQTATDAVNQGAIFRFLSKPCDSEVLASTLEQAIRQHELITSEKSLLQDTLKGSIRMLVVEGTYVLGLENLDVRIFLEATYADTLARRRARARDADTPFVEKVLAIEHEAIGRQSALAAQVVGERGAAPVGEPRGQDIAREIGPEVQMHRGWPIGRDKNCDRSASQYGRPVRYKSTARKRARRPAGIPARAPRRSLRASE